VGEIAGKSAGKSAGEIAEEIAGGNIWYSLAHQQRRSCPITIAYFHSTPHTTSPGYPVLNMRNIQLVTARTRKR
jgi:hypothetical protein